MRLEEYFGVPLGGIGTGKINFYRDLTIGDITIMNNWSNPLKVVRGFHIVYYMRDNPVFLQLNPGKNIESPPPYTHIKDFDVEVEYPKISYYIPLQDVSKVEVYSILIKDNVKDSAIPAIKIRVIANGRFAISFPNVTGSKRASRVNIPYKGKINGVIMKNKRALQTDPSYGEIFLGCKDCNVMTNY
ncbi:hypothetical protein DJ522_08090, partial [Sulfolobus sp. F3]